MEKRLNHFDEEGNAVMVDVSGKNKTVRCAVAKGRILVNRETYQAICSGSVKKGDVLGVARIAGIMGVKQTSSLIPMCHPIMIHSCSIDFLMDEKCSAVNVTCRVKTEGETGVEMEALTGVHIALLTIYDMCKAIDKTMEMGSIYLESKTGGKSGDFKNPKAYDRQ